MRTAADSRTRTANDPAVLQLMQQAQGKVKPRATPPGTFPPGMGLPTGGFPIGGGPDQGGQLPQLGKMPTPPAGGKGGLFKKESVQFAKDAIKTEGTIDPANAYAVEQKDQQRRFDQLGLPRTGGNRIFIQDLSPDHAAAITRTVGGQTAISQGADIRTDAPKRNVASQKDKDEVMHEYLKAKPNAGVDDLATFHANNLISSVDSFGTPISNAALDAAQKHDGKKTFMTMSYGASPEMNANQTAFTMLRAPKGTKLYDQTVATLGHEPTVRKDGEHTVFDAKELEKLKKDAIYPAFDKAMSTPEYTERMGAARTRLEGALDLAKKQNIMVFQAAGNDYGSAERAGRPDMAVSTTDGIKGLFQVGATQPNGAGTADDQVAPFSNGGRVTASAAGMAIPVGVKGGKATNVDGTSFASPLMAENAYLVSSANPKLSIDEIQRVLTDPRVARDIAGTTRDGAGVVDPLAASLVAKYPRITAAQIDQIRTQLDANPNAKFLIQSDGTLRTR